MLELAFVPLHLGALHSYEKALVALIAFGPFLVLFVVVYVIRRRDIAAEDSSASSEQPAQGGEDPGGAGQPRRG